MANAMNLTKKDARKVLAIVEQGLCRGLGKPEPGQMCVEAAVCFALGLPHSDNPPCVSAAVRSFKIRLNDSQWPSDADRAEGMKRLAIAQLGSDGIDEQVFRDELQRLTIQRIVPLALRAAASMKANAKHKDQLLAAAKRCEDEGTREASLEGRKAAYAAYAADADAAAAYAADAAAEAAYSAAAADAADAAYAAYAAYAAAAYAADAAAYAAYAADAAAEAACAAAAAYAAYAADAYAAAKKKAKDSARLKILRIAADVGVAALQAAGSIGCKWLDIIND